MTEAGASQAAFALAGTRCALPGPRNFGASIRAVRLGVRERAQRRVCGRTQCARSSPRSALGTWLTRAASSVAARAYVRLPAIWRRHGD